MLCNFASTESPLLFMLPKEGSGLFLHTTVIFPCIIDKVHLFKLQFYGRKNAIKTVNIQVLCIYICAHPFKQDTYIGPYEHQPSPWTTTALSIRYLVTNLMYITNKHSKSDGKSYAATQFYHLSHSFRKQGQSINNVALLGHMDIIDLLVRKESC